MQTGSEVTPSGAFSHSVIDAQTRHRMIQEAAYSLYERGGFVHGHDLDDWLAAEAYVDASVTPEQGRRAERAESEVHAPFTAASTEADRQAAPATGPNARREH